MTVRTLRLFRARGSLFTQTPNELTSSTQLPKEHTDSTHPRYLNSQPWPAAVRAEERRHAIRQNRKNRKEASKTLLFINLNFKAESVIFASLF